MAHENQRLDTGMNQDEMLSLLSTLVGIPAERIGGWVILVQGACGEPDCVGLGCEEGPMALLSAAHTDEGSEGTREPYILHMCARVIDQLAAAMAR